MTMASNAYSSNSAPFSINILIACNGFDDCYELGKWRPFLILRFYLMISVHRLLGVIEAEACIVVEALTASSAARCPRGLFQIDAHGIGQIAEVIAIA